MITINMSAGIHTGGEPIETKLYEVNDDGCSERFEADADAEALDYARWWLETGDWDRSETLFLDARVRRIDVEIDDDSHAIETEVDIGSVQVTLQPEEPRCVDRDASHDWQSPHEIVGGLEENPGVHGHGGGVIIHEVCMRCGCGKTTDTWAQDSCGRQGLTSVSYEPDQYAQELADLAEEAAQS